jgi:hypothetical protein
VALTEKADLTVRQEILKRVWLWRIQIFFWNHV